jgi:RNA polymerase sigma factor (sigma-70 family)
LAAKRGSYSPLTIFTTRYSQYAIPTVERKVYNFCLRQTRNRSDAMDLLQDVFLAVYRHLPSWRGEGELQAWIMRIAVNKSMDFYRQRQRTPQTDSDEHAEAALLDWQAPTSHEPAHMHDLLNTNADRRQLVRFV